MLQRKMDSSADYGTPLVVPEKGWLQKVFDHKKVEKIPVITSKVPVQTGFWSKLKYFTRIETPIRVAGVVMLGTLLGAAYAVTNSDKQQAVDVAVSATDYKKMSPQEREVATPELVTASASVVNEFTTPSSEFLSNNNDAFNIATPKKAQVSGVINDFSFLQKTVSENDDKVVLALIPPEINQENIKTPADFKLVSTEKSFKITHPKTFNLSNKVIDEAVYTNIIIPKELVPDVVESEVGLSKYEKKRIIELEKKLALVQEKLNKFDMVNLKLQGKFEMLVVKNKALSDQLRHIDTVTTGLKNR